MEIDLKETKNNRPRVEWKDGKPVDATKNKHPAAESKPAETRVKKTQKRPQKAEREYVDENETDILDFFMSLKNKRHIVIAFFVILALSIGVAAVAVSVADGDPLTVPTEENTAEMTEIATETATEEASEIVPLVDEPDHAGHGHAVCIDPGHGFDDVGTSNDELGVYEKDVVLAVSLKLREKLEDEGVKVYMTHDTNTPPPESDENKLYLFGMKKRTSMANSLSDVSLYISIHCDAFYEDTSVRGSRIFHMSDEPDSESVANAIAESLINAGSEKTPLVKSMTGMNSYQVLRDTDMAAVLVETGFVSNEDEAKAMLTDEWVDYMAGALADAIVKSFEDKVI